MGFTGFDRVSLLNRHHYRHRSSPRRHRSYSRSSYSSPASISSRRRRSPRRRTTSAASPTTNRRTSTMGVLRTAASVRMTFCSQDGYTAHDADAHPARRHVGRTPVHDGNRRGFAPRDPWCAGSGRRPAAPRPRRPWGIRDTSAAVERCRLTSPHGAGASEGPCISGGGSSRAHGIRTM
jgi:hypothetical protein